MSFLFLYNNCMGVLKKIIPFFIIILFAATIYFRVLPLLNQTVPYTYDQGRDFLQAEQIIRYKNMTLIGPTTGSQGIFHGAWWYYLLAVFYAVFQGWPLGFYWGLFFVSLVSVALFYIFVKKEFGFAAGLMFLSVVSVSPYFSRLAFFPANNIVVPVFVLLLIYSLYTFFETSDKKYAFLIALSIGFIFEFEVAFGAFLIPSFLIAMLFFKDIRKIFADKILFSRFFAGIAIPFIPRLLFELKYRFLQIQSAFNVFKNPTADHPQDFRGLAIDRSYLIAGYFKSIFEKQHLILGYGLLFLAFTGLWFVLKKNKTNHKEKTALFLLVLFSVLFLLTLAYKNNFFWDYYLEGIQYVYLFLMIAFAFSLSRILYVKHILLALSLFFFIVSLFVFGKDILRKKNEVVVGLKANTAIVEYILQQAKRDDFCAKVYTPPVFPHTYNYLFDYFTLQGYKKPSLGFVDNVCWYIVEPDVYEFRIEQWRKDHIPKKAYILNTKAFENGVIVEQWREDYIILTN